MGAEQESIVEELERDPALVAGLQEYMVVKAVREVEQTRQTLAEQEAERDRRIRQARASMTLGQLAELTGLSSQRILQIAPASGGPTRKR